MDADGINNMESLITIVNKLQDAFHSVGMLDTIDLPQIAVVGSQSSGKSSVLETIVGRDFLPRGAGIVTRRPLVLQLLNIPKEGRPKDQEEWGEFLHIQNKKFFDFTQIRSEIEKETDRVTGKNKGISPLPIHLRIYSPYVLNLTLIDLPGITKVPVGDQPTDIEKQIRKMILQFISRPNCIILAVTPANTDLANSDALKLAKEVDPRGDRTLGVLTKLDLMDPGTDALDILMGRVYPLRRGFIGVVLRGQKDIDGGKLIRQALTDEAAYFQRHPSYKPIAAKLGTPFLAKTLNLILLHHIRECLPEIKSKISALITQAQQVLNEYGSPLSDSRVGQGGLVLQLVNEFATNFVEAIDGKASDLSTQELFGGARINYIFIEKYAPYMTKLDPCEGLTEKDIRMAIRNAKGPRSSLFVPESSFEMLVRKQVQLLEEPSLRCVDQVFDELLRIVEHSEKHLVRFPNLRERMVEFVIGLLRKYLVPLRDFIQDLIKIELAYINTNHPDFFGGGQTINLLIDKLQSPEYRSALTGQKPPVPQRAPGAPGVQQPPQQPVVQDQQAFASREAMETDIIRTLLTAYMNIVRKNITDSVPKAIMCFLVNKSKQHLQNELVSAMYKDELFDELLKENDDIAAKRKAAQEMLKVLRKAQDIINDVRDIKV